MLEIDLNETVALVLGGSRGIGAGITRAFAQAGAFTFFTHTGSPAYRDRVSALVEELHSTGSGVESIVADATSSEQTDATVRRVLEARGRLDVLVFNVGRNPARAAETVPDEEWQSLLDLNLSAAFYGVRAVLPPMLEAGRGKIILIGSSAATDGGGGAIDYAAAKAGLVGMMRYLMRNYARRGIVTNVIHPCVIETDLLRQRYGEPAKRQQLIDQVPVGRLGQPEDIAGLAAFLASCRGDFIAGQEILVDGGRTMYR
ncbi:MAG: SDR family oxidoreductase [Lentisphaerae bacterium]|jgi:3-oxoacyl-[acyl-carrier protein] reductase|nr:SDR family oxidoreductase [Lentisphaerota bacterium]MBT5609870.1 SDR family oxidoreductase [Lentisphaerota bacterium]MBT7060009.1 SDR family oxidoreductase [Lentisphaerota bacterium]MBT7842494.1 SDR family oxidoreductase [Lentisphaerota bacterium]